MKKIHSLWKKIRWNVVNEIRKSMSLSTLGLVVENAGEISTKRMNFAEAIEKRTCSEGNINYEAESDWYRKILVLEYAESNFSNYCSPKENHDNIPMSWNI